MHVKMEIVVYHTCLRLCFIFSGEMTEEEKAKAEEHKKIVEKKKAKAAEKAKLSKSLIIMEVKPWDDETGKKKVLYIVVVR